jgi:hypothetical protein
MTEERNKILEMLAAGKISSEDAARLLDKLESAGANGTEASGKTEDKTASPGKTPRFLRIVMQKPNEDQVNIRIPLAFARSSVRLMAVLPPKISQRLAQEGIDLGMFGTLNEEDLDEVLRELNVNINKGNGKAMQIFCE